MSRHMSPLNSEELASAIRSEDYARAAATVVGYGNMGRQFVAALQDLGVTRIHVCSRFRTPPPAELSGVPGVVIAVGGVEALKRSPAPGELGIVATPELHEDRCEHSMCRQAHPLPT